MKEKKITVIVSESPSPLVAERLRMSVGLTLEDDNKVGLLFTDSGVHTLGGVDQSSAGFDLDRHLEMFTLMELPVYVHTPSAKARGVTVTRKGITPVDDNEVAALLRESDLLLG